jgi:hypothetical protein
MVLTGHGWLLSLTLKALDVQIIQSEVLIFLIFNFNVALFLLCRFLFQSCEGLGTFNNLIVWAEPIRIRNWIE